MLVFPDLKLIYIRVPATGSTSFVQSLTETWPESKERDYRGVVQAKLLNNIRMQDHFTAEQGRLTIPAKIWNSYEKIGFVREPLSWAKSIYRKTAIVNSIDINNSGTFEDFLRRLDKTPYYWFTDHQKNVIIDTIYRMEDMANVCKKYQIGYKHINPAATFREITVTPQAETILREKFWREYEHYDPIRIPGNSEKIDK